tara:strand:+ start:2113 stop:2253 length:141 start_codon:yes stop_codon:yes gene_type:complete
MAAKPDRYLNGAEGGRSGINTPRSMVVRTRLEFSGLPKFDHSIAFP